MRQEPSELIGVSRAIVELRAEIERVAQSDSRVLITGESGSGKEVVARAIAAKSPRTLQPFVALNCAGMPEARLEAELFGHLPSGTNGSRNLGLGKLEQASQGTLFLDEIGELTYRMQGLLLRFLETGEVQPPGSERPIPIKDVRVITATNRDLRDLIAQGQFREDLFYRLNVIHLVMPPLRERREDVPELIQYFLRCFTSSGAGHGVESNGHVNGNGHAGGNGHGHAGINGHAANGHVVVRGFSPDVVQVLRDYAWPGNVRQLENLVERLVVTGRREIVQVDELAPELRTPAPSSGRPRRERRRTVADDLFRRLTEDGESFWNAVYPLYMNRDITRANVRDLVHKGLEEARGNYKIVLRLFNMDSGDYKRFLNFLRKHECQLPFKEYR